MSTSVISVDSQQRAQSQQPKRERESIHSGHFMVSDFEAEEQDDEDETAIPIPDDDPDAETANNLSAEGRQQCLPLNNETARKCSVPNLPIDTSLSKLFQCMSLAYRQKLTSPKWNRFRGIRLRWKDKIRLNNVIWRCWHLQFIKKENTLICQFASPLDVDTHTKPEAIVLEGKYWKRKLAAVTAEYKKWRLYYRNHILGHARDELETLNESYLLPWSIESTDNADMLVDEDYMGLMSDTLFSTITNTPFTFPNSREMAKAGLAEFIQPSLGPLQPNLDDCMDTFEPFQVLLAGRLPSVSEDYTEASWSYSTDNNTSNALAAVASFQNQVLLPSTIYQYESEPNGTLITVSETTTTSNSTTNTIKLSKSLPLDNQISYIKSNVTDATVVVNDLIVDAANTNFPNQSQVSSLNEATTISFPFAIQDSLNTGRAEYNNEETTTAALLPHVDCSIRNQSATKSQLTICKSKKSRHLKTKLKHNVHTIRADNTVEGDNKKATTCSDPLKTTSVLLAKTSNLTTISNNKCQPSTSSSTTSTLSLKNRQNTKSSNDSCCGSNKLATIPLEQSSATLRNEIPSKDPTKVYTFGSVSTLVESPRSLLDTNVTAAQTTHKVQKRVEHIFAEQKRRYNIKTGFEMLQILVPQVNENPNIKLSKAALLQKGADYIRQLKLERLQIKAEANSLRQQIDLLNTSINNCQSMLPATGAPVPRNEDSKLQKMFSELVENRTKANWKFWIFSAPFKHLLLSFSSSVSSNSLDELYRSTMLWIEQHCSLVDLRPVVVNSLKYLCTQTDILSNPDKLPEESHEMAIKENKS